MASEWIVPNADVGGYTVTLEGSGSGVWDRINSHFVSTSPDDSTYFHGINQVYCRVGFENPTFTGTTTEIIVHGRGNNDGSAQVRAYFYSNGTDLDTDWRFSWGYGWQNQHRHVAITKTAAQLTNMELYMRCDAGFYHDNCSEIELEMVGITIPPPGAPVEINIGDTWKLRDSYQINIGDVWKAVTEMKINIGDVWKDIE